MGSSFDRFEAPRAVRGIVVALLFIVPLGIIGWTLLEGGEDGAGAGTGATEVVATEVVATEAVDASGAPTPVLPSSPIPSTSPSSSATPTPTPTPAEDSVDAQVAELRETDMWEGLAEYDRAGEGRALFLIGNDEGFVGPFSNAEELWNSFAPDLRDRMLRRVVTEGIRPDTVRFFGKPIEDDFVSGVRPWWSAADTGTRGRGIMLTAQASYATATGQHRRINWPVLIGIDVSSISDHSGRLLDIGPPQDLSMEETGNTVEEANMQFNEHHLDWLFDKEVVTESRHIDCPEAGCVPYE